MENLREILDGKIGVIFEGQDKSGETYMKVLAPWAQAGEPTANKRIYPRALLQREITRLDGQIKSGAFIGGGDHHPSGFPSIGNASHIVEKVWMDSAGKCWCEMRILPTSKGKDVMALIKGGATLGLSTMGRGTVDPKTNEVQSDLKLQSIDIVSNPAYKGSAFNKDSIFESVGFETKIEKEMKHKMDLINAHHQKAKKVVNEAGETKKEGRNKMGRTPLEEEIRTNLIVNYHTAKKEKGFTGTFEEWKATDKNEQLVIAAVEFNAGRYPSIEEALTANDVSELIEEHLVSLSEVDSQKYANEAFHAGVNPKDYAEMINRNIREKIKIAVSKSDDEHRASLLDEARQAGFDTSTPEKRAEIISRSEQVVIEETDEDLVLEAEAVKIHAQLIDEDISLDTVRRGLIKEREAKEAEALRQGRIASMVRESMLAGPAKKF